MRTGEIGARAPGSEFRVAGPYGDLRHFGGNVTICCTILLFWVYKTILKTSYCSQSEKIQHLERTFKIRIEPVVMLEIFHVVALLQF